MSNQPHLFAGVAGYVGRPDEVGIVGVFRRHLPNVNGTIMSLALQNTVPKQIYLAARYNGGLHGTHDGA
ncbi:MAG: hypothetical protein AAGB04_26020 [Pseudomonadota bacterium]